MKISKKNKAIHAIREDKSDIHYYLFDEHEIHSGILPPGVIQPWHHHTKISESLLILNGQVVFHYLENNKKKEITVYPGDVIEVENTPHTFSNPFDQECHMVAFRFFPSGKPTQHLIKQDKVLDTHLENAN